MEIPREGLGKDDILARLQAFKANDLAWQSGRVWAYSYDLNGLTQETAKEAYMLYLSENGLDPTTYPSMHKVESDVVRMVATLLRGDASVVGNCTSGGTESIICAVKTARDWAREHKPHITEPEILLPMTAHAAFYKAAHYLGVKPVAVPFDPATFKVDINAMAAAITPNTILLVGSAPGYAQGVIDPIPDIASLALKYGILCHVDACVGGIFLSVLRELGKDVPPFDFTVPGVTSISADMHKYGYAPKNVSVVMYRNKELRKYQIFSCMRTTTYALINTTVLSTKSGGPLAGAWAVLHHLGQAGYQQIVQESMDATRTLVEGINAMGTIHVLGVPDMCMFSLASAEINVFELADEMRDRGWYLQPQFSTPLSPPNLHITVNPAGLPNVDAFLTDLRAGVEAVKNNPEPIDPAPIREVVQQLTADVSPEKIAELMALSGFEPGTMPGKMGLINTVMDAVPRDLAEMLLTEFMNDLYA